MSAKTEPSPGRPVRLEGLVRCSSPVSDEATHAGTTPWLTGKSYPAAHNRWSEAAALDAAIEP
jgi:hypothetical protein